MTEYDTHWIETQYNSDYANLPNPPTRRYAVFPKDPALNFPQLEDYALRILKRYPKELQRIDVIMYRITDERQTNALIAALQRGIPVRLLSDTKDTPRAGSGSPITSTSCGPRASRFGCAGTSA
jgi:phosphatidylserine/phosphatidylglycerophosphate/cardiolipin synthase-like enzyme